MNITYKNPPLYTTWKSMLHRCHNPKGDSYPQYGGRGIYVCESWHDYINFLNDMWPKPSKGHSLDRIDNNKGYSPENCRWATKKEQQRNRRCTSLVTIEGKTYKAIELAEKTRFRASVIIKRASQGLTLKEVLDPRKRTWLEGLKVGGKANGLRLQRLDHCKNGHEYTLKNTHITPQGWRSCRTCSRNKTNRQRDERVAKGLRRTISYYKKRKRTKT